MRGAWWSIVDDFCVFAGSRRPSILPVPDMFTSSSFSISGNDDGEEADESEDEIDDDVPWRSPSEKIAWVVVSNPGICLSPYLDLISFITFWPPCRRKMASLSFRFCALSQFQSFLVLRLFRVFVEATIFFCTTSWFVSLIDHFIKTTTIFQFPWPTICISRNELCLRME